MLKKLLSILFNIIITLAVFAFTLGFLVSDQWIKPNFELPLSEINGITVDSNDNVYVGLNYFSSIQVYDKFGNFLKNWHIHNEGGLFNFAIDDYNQIIVDVTRLPYLKIFDNSGNEILKPVSNLSTTDSYKYKNGKFVAKNGRVYEIKGTIFKSIVMTYPEIKSVVEQSLWKQIFSVPKVLILIGIGILGKLITKRL
ncbi:hypothetical protein [Winogradskyella sp. UBA3174]|uniref:hypothetical protein n=1 Tax=Winogradskyella sp. UBA3174 TaxID=1947785 RepID=UPI0025CF1364|nr:hypothetical protein [Winogradskyella sp. UBA3174]|tara:strand:+ start:1875 stop:2465 length:591 start_codon:yes stop_codon:yes gene_type:complete